MAKWIKQAGNAVPFKEEDVKNYLDKAIKTWRDKKEDETAQYYVDAFQSVRTSLFGETLPEEVKEEETEE